MKKTKKLKSLLLVLLLSISFIGCDALFVDDSEETTTTETETTETTETYEVVSDVDFTDDEYTDYTEDYYETLDGDSDSYEITEAGVYVLTGSITETIVINVDEEEDVRLVLVDVSIITNQNQAILVLSADDVEISVAANTVNYLSDSDVYSVDYFDYNAVIYSEADLVINGTGSLEINAVYNNAIVSRDDLVIVDVTLDITSVDDGIIGRDSLSIQDADITVTCDGDAFKSTNDSLNKGYIYIDSGTFTVTAGDDGFDAENYIVVNSGTFNLVVSDKGFNAGTDIYLYDGNFEIDAVDAEYNADGEIYYE